MRRYAGAIVLVVLAIAFGVLVLRDPRSESDGERALRKDNVFSAWRPDHLAYVSIATRDGTVRLDRDAKNRWTIHGSADEADQARADLLLAELEHATVLRKVEKAGSLGVAVARVRGEIGMGELVYRFSLGHDAQKPEGAAYLEVEGKEGAFVVEKRLATALLVPIVEYRDKRLVAGKDPPQSITIFPPGLPSFSLVRDGKVRRRLGADGPYAARGAADELATALAELRASRFLGAEEGGRLLGGANVALEVATETGTQSFAKGGACPDAPDDVVFARTSAPAVYACVPKAIVTTALRGRDVYVDTMAFYARTDEVEEITVERPGKPKLDLARKGSGFRLREGEGRDLDAEGSDGVKGWLGALLGLAGEPRAGVRDGAEVATVGLVYGAIKETVRFVRVAGMGLVAVRADGQGVVLAPVAERIVSPPAALLRGPRLVPRRSARALRIECGGLVQDIARKEGLRFSGPEPFPLDVPLASRALSTVLDARAEAWVSDTRAGFVPASPPCRATLSFEGDAAPSTTTLELSSPTEGTVYGAVVGGDEVFLASPSLVATLTRPLVSREAFAVDVERAYELTVFEGLGVTKVGLEGEPGAVAKDALASLRPLFAVRRGGLAAAEIDPSAPRVVVGLRVDGGPAKDASIRFGKEVSAPEGKVVYAVRDGVPFVFAVGPEPVKKLLALVRKSP